MRVSSRQPCFGVALWLFASIAGCAGSEAASSTRTTGVIATGEAPEAAPTRHRNHGGVLRLIAVSLQELNLTPDQRTTLEALKADLLAKMEPGRTAGRDLANVLADGVATGAVDRAKAELAATRLSEATARFHEAKLEDLDRLHATLTPEQRAALIAKMQVLWARWQDEWQGVDLLFPEPAKTDMAELTATLGLSPEQVSRIQARFTSGMQGVVADYPPREAAAHAEVFGSKFTSDAFDARTVEPVSVAPTATFGATRMTRFFEAFAPELTPAQRVVLAQTIRDHSSRHDSNE